MKTSNAIKNSKSAILLSIGLCICILTGCKKDGVGDITSKFAPVENFQFLEVDGTFDIILIQDTMCSIEFVGEKRVVDRCSAIQTNQTISIRGSKSGEFIRPNEKITTVYIHVDTLSLIHVNSDCVIKSQNALTGTEIGLVVGARSLDADLQLNCEVFYYWNNPNGTHLRLTGQTNQLKIWNSGLGIVDASEVYTPYVEIVNGGQNTCKVRATQKLEYSLTSVGNILYFGNPSELVLKTLDGTGQLIKGD